MTWIEAIAKVGELARMIANLEFQYKQQGGEIEKLRTANADLLKVNSNLAERVARLEEGRITMGVQMQAFLDKQETNAKMDKILERLAASEAENAQLKRAQLPPLE